MSEDLTHRINSDLTGVLIDLGFTFIGRCNCNHCLTDKYKNGDMLLKLCRMRSTFEYWNKGDLIQRDKFNLLPKTLNEINQKNNISIQ